MKKQILIITATILSVGFFSCTKQRIETTKTTISGETPTVMNLQRSNGNSGTLSGSLKRGLLCEFEFDGTLKDVTGNIAAGVSTTRPLYTSDRKGIANSAIQFNEKYGVNIFDIPLGTDMSLSVWVKNDMYPQDYKVPFIEGDNSFAFHQFEDVYQASYWNGINGQYTISGPIDQKWHHLAATRDNNTLEFYLDGVLIGSAASPANSGPYPSTSGAYSIGYGYNGGYKYWNGSMDDLRIYNRVLSASEIKGLSNF